MKTEQNAPVAKSNERHPFIIIVAILLLVFIAAAFIPSGMYDRITTPDGRTIVDPETFRFIENPGLQLESLLTAIPRGIAEASNVVIITLMIGGAFGVIKEVGMLDVGVEKLVKVFSKQKIIIIYILFFVFALICGFIGVPELCLVYIPVLMPLMFRLGFDSLTSVAISLLSTASGFSAAWSAPATVGLGHELSDLPLYSGMGLRIASAAILALVGAVYVALYARRILKDPKKSLVYEEDLLRRDEFLEEEPDAVHKYPRVILAGIATILLFLGLIVGVVVGSWGFFEMSGYFILMGVIPGLIAGMGLNNTIKAFETGMHEMLVGALICGMARGISVVLNDAQVMDTIIMYLAKFVVILPAQIASVGIFLITSAFNAVIASGSGKAVIALPIMIPLADIAEVNRQVTILAYQLGDGITNVLWPASGYFMAALAIGKINYNKWFKFFFPLFIIWMVVGSLIVLFAQYINYGPF